MVSHHPSPIPCPQFIWMELYIPCPCLKSPPPLSPMYVNGIQHANSPKSTVQTDITLHAAVCQQWKLKKMVQNLLTVCAVFCYFVNNTNFHKHTCFRNDHMYEHLNFIHYISFTNRISALEHMLDYIINKWVGMVKWWS